jgi:Domain of unknown function (DUF4345)
MQRLALLLRILAPVFFLIAALHLALGMNADALLGATVSAATAAEPSLSSQNRFYGVAFALYGAVLYLCSKDLRTYAVFFKAAMWVFLLAGVARLVAWVQHGAPAPAVIALLAVELVVPPVLLAWHARAASEA